jgi:hypothetical protein
MLSLKKPYNSLLPDYNNISPNSLLIAFLTPRNKSSLIPDLLPLSLPIIVQPLSYLLLIVII